MWPPTAFTPNPTHPSPVPGDRALTPVLGTYVLTPFSQQPFPLPLLAPASLGPLQVGVYLTLVPCLRVPS